MHSLGLMVLDKMDIGVVVIDRNREIVIWNRFMEGRTGRHSKEAAGKRLSEICRFFGRDMYERIIDDCLNNGQNRFLSHALHKFECNAADSAFIGNLKYNIQIEPIDECGEIRYALIQFYDITTHYERVNELKSFIQNMSVDYERSLRAEELNRSMALHDQLTGLPNRYFLNDQMAWIVENSRRNKEKFAVIFTDLDNFKNINDTYGHGAGDMVLKEFASRMKSCVRRNDIVARFAGDEFVIVLLGVKNRNAVETVAKKLVESLDKRILIGEYSVEISASFGISMYPSDGEVPDELMKSADCAMYVSKKSGKNSYSFSPNVM